MNLSRKKVLDMIAKRIVEIEKAHEASIVSWNKEVKDYYVEQVEEAKEKLEKARARLAETKRPTYNPEYDEELSYSLSKAKPKELPEIHKKLRELCDVLEAVEEDSIKVSPQIERALGLKW